MGTWIASSPDEEKEMLAACGVSSTADFYADVPRSARLEDPLDMPAGKSEFEVKRALSAMAASNEVYPTMLRGAGAYRHYIPAAVKQISAKETFVTAYTPYQAEISQGILQSIFEYQSMICELTGMDASNASVYDGSTAAAEAVAMCRERDRSTVYVSLAAHPHTIETIETYCFGSGVDIVKVPLKNGLTDIESFRALAGENPPACLYMQSPNFYGLIENVAEAAALAHSTGAKLIAGCNPLSLAILKTPAECGADIAVGEGQPLGLPLSWGGPYLGFMACRSELVRKLPGRIVGETADQEGRRAFVLTLQAREQHIRREKASSNICSNEALCALTASCYLSVMGPSGLREAATQCFSKARYAAERISALPGFGLAHGGEFFHEFVTACPDVEMTLSALASRGILGGLPVAEGILWCVTEVVTKEEIDLAVSICAEVASQCV